jgi:GMP synthase-like glutamine amidotransferase
VLAVVNNGTPFLTEMRRSLGSLGVEYQLIPASEPMVDGSLESFSGVILTGGDVHVYDHNSSLR